MSGIRVTITCTNMSPLKIRQVGNLLKWKWGLTSNNFKLEMQWQDKSNYIDKIERRYEQLDNDMKKKCTLDSEMKECLKFYFKDLLLAK